MTAPTKRNSHRSALRSLALALLFIGSAQYPAANALRPKTRNATVGRTLAVRSPLTRAGEATGFVWGRKGDTTFVITVLASDLLIDVRSRIVAKNLRILSHPGTDRQAIHKGAVAAYDTFSGLTVVAVKGKLPSPISFAAAPARTGASVHIATTPIKRDRSTHDKQLPVSVTPSHVAAIRQGKSFVLLQLDGDVPLGGEGGPVISPDGKVVGIAFGRWDNTLVSFAIPAASVRRFLSGAPGLPKARGLGSELELSVSLLDLARKVKSCTFYLLPKDKVKEPASDANGVWALLAADMVSLPADVTHPTVFWKKSLLDTNLASGTYWVQARTVLANGASFVSSPALFTCERPRPPLPVPAQKSLPEDADIAKVECTNNAPGALLGLSRCFTRRTGDFDLIGFTLQQPEAAKKKGGDGTPANWSDTRPMHGAAWDPSGRMLYALSQSILPGYRTEITRIARPQDAGAARVAFKQSVGQIHYTRWGLVAVVLNRGLVLLDHRTLALKARLSLPGIAELHVPSAGQYAIAVTRTKPQTGSIDWGVGPSYQGGIAALHVVNFIRWREGRVYRGEVQPLPTVPSHAMRLQIRYLSDVGLTDDGAWVLVRVEGKKAPAIRSYPFENGQIYPNKGTFTDLPATAFQPVPGRGRMLVSLPRQQWSPKNPRPEGAPEKGSGSFQIVNPARPNPKGKRFWATIQAASADHLFLFNNADRVFRSLDLKGKEDLAVSMPAIHSVATWCKQIVPAPRGRSVLLAWERLWCLLEPRPGGSPKDAGGAAARVAEVTAKERPLGTVTGRTLFLRWERTPMPDIQCVPYQALSSDRSVIFVANKTGIIHRLDLERQVDTATVNVKAECDGMVLTRSGLVTAMRGVGLLELQLRDATTLQLRQRWPLATRMRLVVSCPATDLVAMVDFKERVSIFDCKTGKLVRPPARLPRVPNAPARLPDSFPTKSWKLSLALSVDGRYLFTAFENRVMRYAMAGGELVPEAASEHIFQTPTSVTVDEDGTYVGVLTSYPVPLADGWGAAPVRKALRPKQGKPTIVVLDARTLRPVYQASGEVSGFLFDKAGSRLVTNIWSRCLPDGTILTGRQGASSVFYPGRRLVHGRDGWIVSAIHGNVIRVRFTPAAVPVQWWGKR